MSLRNTDERYGWPSRMLHWLIAILILCLAMVGWIMGELPKNPKYFWVYDLHKSFGILVLALMVIRLGWRLYAGSPKPVPGTPTWQHLVATVTHWAIYAMAFAMPISGWLYDSASGLRALKFFGLFVVPKLTAPDPELKATTHAFHEYGVWILLALVAAHAGAALWHHLIQKDRTLMRMLPASLEKKDG